MLVPELNMALLNIPKCGSSTVRKCLENHAQKRKMVPQSINLIDHLSISEMSLKVKSAGLDIQNLRVVGIIRKPIERYLSALNYAFSDKYSRSLKEYVGMTLTDRGKEGDKYTYKTYFRTMSSFLDLSIKNLALYRFEDLQEAVASFGYTGFVPHLNKSRKRFSMEQLDPYMEDILSFYEDDIKLYNSTPLRAKQETTLCM